MKKWLFIIMALGLLSNCYAQDNKIQSTMKMLIDNYNAGNFNEIFSAFSLEMKQALSLEESKGFFSDLKSNFGKISSFEFYEMRDDGLTSLKTHFDKAILLINISVDDNGNINGLLVEPYSEKNPIKNSIMSLDGIPKDISDIIFNLVSVFPNKTQLAISLVKNGKVEFYGVIKENDTLRSIDNRFSVFEIGSITKVLTSTVLADFVVKGKVKLDDNINKYFSFPFKNDIKISFLSLSNHTSGLVRMPSNLLDINSNNPYRLYSKSDLEDYLKNSLILESVPGEKHSYTNLGAGLLGYTLGKIENCDFKDLLRKTVFDKYKMTNSYTGSSKVTKNLVAGLDNNGSEVNNWDFDVLFGAGGVLSDVNDLSKFLLAHFDENNKELTLTRQPTFSFDNIKIAMGWHIIKPGSEYEFYWHNGGTLGYSSSMAMNINNRTGVIILSNVSSLGQSARNIDKICFQLMKHLEKQ